MTHNYLNKKHTPFNSAHLYTHEGCAASHVVVSRLATIQQRLHVLSGNAKF